jgi:hypothetical protein
MNVAYKGPWPQLTEADALLMDVARRIQLTRTKHEAAERNFRLCRPINHVGGNKILEAVRRAIAKVGPLGETVHDAIVSHHAPRVSRLLLLAVVLYAEKLLAEAEHLIERADEWVGGIVRRMSTLGESEASERALPLDNFCIEVFIALRLCAIQDPLAILDR